MTRRRKPHRLGAPGKKAGLKAALIALGAGGVGVGVFLLARKAKAAEESGAADRAAAAEASAAAAQAAADAAAARGEAAAAQAVAQGAGARERAALQAQAREATARAAAEAAAEQANAAARAAGEAAERAGEAARAAAEQARAGDAAAAQVAARAAAEASRLETERLRAQAAQERAEAEARSRKEAEAAARAAAEASAAARAEAERQIAAERARATEATARAAREVAEAQARANAAVAKEASTPPATESSAIAPRQPDVMVPQGAADLEQKRQLVAAAFARMLAAVAAKNPRNTHQQNVNTAAAWLRARKVVLDKPDPRVPFWQLPIGEVDRLLREAVDLYVGQKAPAKPTRPAQPTVKTTIPADKLRTVQVAYQTALVDTIRAAESKGRKLTPENAMVTVAQSFARHGIPAPDRLSSEVKFWANPLATIQRLTQQALNYHRTQIFTQTGYKAPGFAPKTLSGFGENTAPFCTVV